MYQFISCINYYKYVFLRFSEFRMPPQQRDRAEAYRRANSSILYRIFSLSLEKRERELYVHLHVNKNLLTIISMQMPYINVCATVRHIVDIVLNYTMYT